MMYFTTLLGHVYVNDVSVPRVCERSAMTAARTNSYVPISPHTMLVFFPLFVPFHGFRNFHVFHFCSSLPFHSLMPGRSTKVC